MPHTTCTAKLFTLRHGDGAAVPAPGLRTAAGAGVVGRPPPQGKWGHRIDEKESVLGEERELYTHSRDPRTPSAIISSILEASSPGHNGTRQGCSSSSDRR